jgi:peptide/nickel transport system ATP-binding protein
VADAALLEVDGLTVDYLTAAGTIRAVSEVSLEVAPGEFLGVVGESGCGKSTLLFAIAQLLSPPAAITAGSVRFKGTDMVTLSDRELRALRWRDFSVVMQSAMNALNPVLTIEAQFKDVMRAHGTSDRATIRKRSTEVLELVGIDPVHLDSYPHQLSGGMRQRAMIAMAMIFTPDLVIMDEPTSALDVVAQRSLMVQIKELQAELGFAVVFVTHDMSLVSHFSDRLIVMYAGQVAESGPVEDVLSRPMHPYTQLLLSAVPDPRAPVSPDAGTDTGDPPRVIDPTPGCRFRWRCPLVVDECQHTTPQLRELLPGHAAACHVAAPDLATKAFT